ncbi:MAG: IS66 family transposase [Gammaproteobacteria bacterium]|nr:IS66 family transposase [Gammaproteobacteria bacterium]
MLEAAKNTQKPVLEALFGADELLRLIAEKDQQISDKDQLIIEQQKRLHILEEQLRLSRQHRFGAQSEKAPGQADLFDEAELEADLVNAQSNTDSDAQDAADDDKTTKPRKKRRGFSGDLPRVRVEYKLTDEEKAGALRTFFTKVKEELDYIPAKVQVTEYWQEKAVFEDEYGETEIQAANRNPHPLGKCMVSTQLLAHIIIAKYADALPLYRQERILQRYGGDISRTTMANWIIRLHDVFNPLIEYLITHQRGGDYLQIDETRIQVLKVDGRAPTSDKWMWVIRGGPPDQPVVLFTYDASRSEKVPLRLLEGFSGFLQADGYAGYNRVCLENALIRIGCWDHARRKFIEADKAAPKKKGDKNPKSSMASIALDKIQKLYIIERQIKDLPLQEKAAQRQARSGPVLDDIKHWMEDNHRKVLRDSLTWKAIQYTLNQWDTLIVYLQDGQLNISNILAENAIRPFAVGRRNWLFADTPRGAHASATCYTLIETAKANGLEPYAYLCHLLNHIATANTPEKLDALLPWNVK